MRLLLTAAMIAFAAPALAEPVELPVRVEDGATWTQTSVRTRTDTTNDETRTSAATTVVRATYRSSDDGQTVRLDFVSFDAEGADAEARRALTEQAKLVFPAVLEVDDTLLPVHVHDWATMREVIFASLSAITDDPRALQMVKDSFPKSGDQAAALFREQSLVALGQGTALELGESRRYDSEVPNILGGPPIKASGEFRLESVDKDAGRAVVRWAQAPDPDSLAASLMVSMEAMVSRAAPEKQAEFKAQLSRLVLERREACSFDIDLTSGLATTTDCTVDVTSGIPGQVRQRIDRWVITQSLPEPR